MDLEHSEVVEGVSKLENARVGSSRDEIGYEFLWLKAIILKEGLALIHNQ